MYFSKDYRLFCSGGMSVTLLEAGASIAAVRLADRRGEIKNVALPLKGLDDLSLAGVTLAPYAGRIPQGRITIDGQTVQLDKNEGDNQIHGGKGTLARKIWRCKGMREGKAYQEIVFCAEAEDGLDGFPGNRYFETRYRLHENQTLEITLSAQTDKPTRVNLSNHAYFNLTGDFSRDVSAQWLEIAADEVYLTDAAFLATACTAPDAALDFRQSRPIGAPRGHAQIDAARGLNHCYVLRAQKDLPAATLCDPLSGRRMRLYTDHACLQVYSGGFLDVPNCAIALEAQEHPESPCAPLGKTLYPGETYMRTIRYAFDAAVGSV